jgi:hypothetical protein
VTALQRGALSRSRIDVPSRKLRTCGLTLQDLFNQVIDDVAVISREAGNETSDVVSTPHRERGQLECGNPPFGALLQGGHVPCGQIKAQSPR